MQLRHLYRLAFALCALCCLATPGFGQQIELISKSVRPATLGAGDSSGAQLSGDAAWVLFLSNADNLVTGDHNTLYVDVFLKNLATGSLELVSANPAGSGGNGNSAYASFSSDGDFVVFQSEASDLVAGDTNGFADIFLWERSSDDLTLVSRTPEALANGASALPSISADGRFIVFESAASNLVAGDMNRGVDVFVFDRETGSIELITVNRDGTGSAIARFQETILGALLPAISSDGTYVAFVSGATNLTATAVVDTERHVYVRNRVAGETVLTSDGTNFVARASTEPFFSEDGTTLVFSATQRLTPQQPRVFTFDLAAKSRFSIPLPTGVTMVTSGPDSPSPSADGQFVVYKLNDQIYLWSQAQQTNSLVSPALTGGPAGGPSQDPIITPDASYIFFLSAARNLQSLATHELFQLFRYERANGEIDLISTNSSGDSGLLTETLYPSVSADGQTIAFELHDADLVPNDDNNAYDVFLLSPEGVRAISTAHPEASGLGGNGASRLSQNALSWDGQALVFSSTASDLVENDSNDAEDVFLRYLPSGPTRMISVDSQAVQGDARSFAPAISADGMWVAFLSYATNLVADDTNNNVDVFLKSTYIGGALSGPVQMLKSGTALIPLNNPPAISADGSVVAYQATQNGSPSPNSSTIFVHKRQSGEVLSMLLQSASGWALSSDGQWLAGELSTGLRLLNTASGELQTPQLGMRVVPVAFSEDGSQLVTYQPGFSGAMNVALFDLASRQFTHTFSNSFSGVLSPDARFLAHEQRLIPAPPSYDLGVFNLPLGTNHSIFPSGDVTNSVRVTTPPVFSRDGRWLTFSTRSTNVLASDQNGMGDTYLFDSVTRQVVLLSATSGGQPANAPSVVPILSRKGDFVVFQSSATDLIENDGNLHSDIYLARLPQTDSDGDGLDDGYEIIFFGSFKQTGDGDTDGDGMSNAAEINAGTNPNDAASVLRMSTAPAENGLILRFASVPGLTYRLQVKRTVDGEWSNGGGLAMATGPELEFLVDLDTEHRFYRLILE